MALLPVFLLLFSFAVAAQNPTQPPKDKQNVKTDDRPLSECTFKSGEQLKFRIHYGFITGGTATISTFGTWLDGKWVMHSSLEGRTSGLIDKLYRVNDVYESYYDIEKNLPLKAVRNIREGSYRFYDEVTYNHDSLYVVSQRKGRSKVPERTLDMVSVMFYLRRIDLASLKPNEVVTFNTWFSDELFPFYVVYKGREKISISSGEYRCFKFVPIVEPGRVFENNDDMTIWFSDDENKIPVSIKFDIWVGSFRCDLESAEMLKFPLSAKIK